MLLLCFTIIIIIIIMMVSQPQGTTQGSHTHSLSLSTLIHTHPPNLHNPNKDKETKKSLTKKCPFLLRFTQYYAFNVVHCVFSSSFHLRSLFFAALFSVIVAVFKLEEEIALSACCLFKSLFLNYQLIVLSFSFFFLLFLLSL